MLDVIVEGLRTIDTVKLTRPPRMADFARWGVATEPSMVSAGLVHESVCGEPRRCTVLSPILRSSESESNAEEITKGDGFALPVTSVAWLVTTKTQAPSPMTFP